MRTESDGIAAAVKSCGEQLGKAERRTGSNTVELGTRTCHIHFDDKTRVENEIEQLALQVHGS